MLNSRTLIVLTAVTASVSVQVLAQQAAAPSQTAPVQTPPGLVATTNNPNLSVATVRLEGGTRAGKMIGQSVYIDGNDKVGTVDDLVITADNKVTVAVIATGGVLGLGTKLIAVPFGQLRLDADRVLLTGTSKDALAAMPAFLY